jgi:hypothetical protein
VLVDAFGQLKEVSAAFAQHMRDASRRSCGVQASEEPAAAAAADHADVSTLLEAERGQAEQLVQQQEGDATAATSTAGYSASGGYSHDAFEAEEQQQQQEFGVAASASAGWSAVLPEDEPHPVLHFQALLQAEQAAAASEPSAASEVADASADSMQFGAAGSISSAQRGTEDISEAFEVVEVDDVLHSAAALVNTISREMLPQHVASAAALHSTSSSIAEALTSTVLPSAQDSAASTVGEELGAYSQLAAPAAAAAEVAIGSQQYGSSSFESYGDSRTMQQQQQQQDRHLLEQQVSEPVGLLMSAITAWCGNCATIVLPGRASAKHPCTNSQ